MPLSCLFSDIGHGVSIVSTALLYVWEKAAGSRLTENPGEVRELTGGSLFYALKIKVRFYLARVEEKTLGCVRAISVHAYTTLTRARARVCMQRMHAPTDVAAAVTFRTMFGFCFCFF